MPKKDTKYKNLIGQIRQTKYGDKYIITNVVSSETIYVKFLDDFGYETKANYKNISLGRIKNIYGKHCYGVGYIGNTTTKEKDSNKQKYSYNVWIRMLQRCYDKKRNKFPTYNDCCVCDEWLCFENFEKWFNENYYEINGEKTFLDKDILSNNMEHKIYSPKTCCFVPRIINNALFVGKNYRVQTANNGKTYYTKISKYGEIYYFRGFKSQQDAINKYKLEKEKYLKELAELYKPYLNQKAYDGLYKYKF